MESAAYYLPLSREPVFKIVQDSDPSLGQNLQATKDLPKGTAVVIYYGQVITTEQNLEKYLADPTDYILNYASYIRSTTDLDKNIDASALIKNPSSNLNLMGVLVNDSSKPKSIEMSDLKAYLATEEQCNLIVSDFTKDYPVYFANQDIQAGQMLTIHYGLGYWLLQMGIVPENIASILDQLE